MLEKCWYNNYKNKLLNPQLKPCFSLLLPWALLSLKFLSHIFCLLLLIIIIKEQSCSLVGFTQICMQQRFSCEEAKVIDVQMVDDLWGNVRSRLNGVHHWTFKTKYLREREHAWKKIPLLTLLFLFKDTCSILTSLSPQAWLAQRNKNVDTLFQQMRNDKCINHSGSAG